VARGNPPDLTRWAEMGARTRLDEIENERQEIFRAFPSLRKGAPSAKPARAEASAPAAPGRRRRSTMSAEQRKAVSERMKRYWAERAKQKDASGNGGATGAAGGDTPARRPRGRKKATERKGRKPARRETAS
jgi:hypothetical protein